MDVSLLRLKKRGCELDDIAVEERLSLRGAVPVVENTFA